MEVYEENISADEKELKGEGYHGDSMDFTTKNLLILNDKFEDSVSSGIFENR
jgi:hypothetical protein